MSLLERDDQMPNMLTRFLRIVRSTFEDALFVLASSIIYMMLLLENNAKRLVLTFYILCGIVLIIGLLVL